MKTLLIGINAKYIHPSMGIFQIVSNSKTETSHCEFNIKDKNESIIEYINSKEFNILGFSVYIWNITKVKEIISLLEKDVSVFLGGPEASYRPSDFFRFNQVKYIIKNEAEESFNELIEHLQGKREIEDVSNLYYRNKKIKYTFDRNPDVNFINHDYSLIKDFKNRIVYLEASRGCCFKCSYCLASIEKSIRYFKIDSVKDEIKYVLDQQAKTVKFLDRSFNVNQKHMREIINYIKDNDNKITTFQFEIVADILDKETINLIQTVRKGLIRFEIGIQSTNDLVTSAVRRVQNFDLLKENIMKIKNNIIIHTDLIAGLPHENKESFINTFNQTFDLFCEELQLGFLKELQGTYISETKNLHEYIFSTNPPYEVIENKYISNTDINEIKLVEDGLNKFYNSGNFKRTCNYLFKEYKLNPYQTFLNVIKFIKKDYNLSKLQHHEISKLFYLSLKDTVGEKLLYIIKQDYLLKDKIKPKIWWDNDISKQERNLIYEKFIQKYNNLNLEILYRYSKLEKYLDEYFLVTYKPLSIYFLTTKA